MSEAEERADELGEYAEEHPDGFTKSDAMYDLGWDLFRFNSAVRAFRRKSAEEQFNLVCDPGDWRSEWTYRLVDTKEDSDIWVDNRKRDLEARLLTAESVVSSIVAATPGRTVDGRAVRLVQGTLHHAREQLELLAS